MSKEEMKNDPIKARETVIGHLIKYPFNTPGASLDWDGIIDLHKNEAYSLVINQIKEDVENWDQEKLEGLDESHRSNYLERLDHMEKASHY